MTKPTVLTLNFSTEDIENLALALSNIGIDATLTPIYIDHLDSVKKSLTDINIVIVKLQNSDLKNAALLEKIQHNLFSLPIILVSNNELQAQDEYRYNADNIIDIRPLKPSFLLAKSIGREISRLHNEYQLHQVRSQFKNETYRFDAFLKHTEDGVALIHEGQYWASNAAYKRIFKIPAGENIIHSPVQEFSSPTSCPTRGNLSKQNLNTSLEPLPDETVLSVLIQTRDGESFITTIYKTHCFVDDQLCTQILIHNPDAWSNVEKGFTDLRSFDHETGLYNQRFSTEYINKEIDSEKPHGSLAFILIDDFRNIREQHGINYADDIIRSVSHVIKQSSASTDVLARYGDSVFTLFSSRLSRSNFLLNCQQVLTDINKSLFGDDSQYVKLTLSIGISFIDPRVTAAKQLISQADKACDKACAAGGNQIHVFDSVTTPLTILFDEENNARLIRDSIEQNRLHPMYQPIVDLSQKSTENYAVLLRILDENKAHIGPDHFILTAEKTGYISQLDEWVLKNTIQQIKSATQQGLKRRFFICLSNTTYRHDSFMETLMNELRLNDIDSSLLVFQINFSDVKTEPIIVKKFTSVIKKETNCQIAFDQIGFSQITDRILSNYHVDYLKIDGSFSQNLINNKESQDTIKNIIEITRRNDVKTIAKSVENANTLALLWNIGIDAAQGFFLQEPSGTMHFDFDLSH